MKTRELLEQKKTLLTDQQKEANERALSDARAQTEHTMALQRAAEAEEEDYTQEIVIKKLSEISKMTWSTLCENIEPQMNALLEQNTWETNALAYELQCRVTSQKKNHRGGQSA